MWHNAPLCEVGFWLLINDFTLSPTRGSLSVWGCYSDGVHGCRLPQQLQD